METIGKYEIVRRMGTGAFGEVYEVRAAGGVRGVLRTCAGEDGMRHRFASAADQLLGLSHPSIASILDTGSVDGVPFLVEEFLPGETLERRLERGAPFTLPESMALLFQLSRALAAAAARGISHRDLRPAHVRLLGEGRIKVQGFGIALLARGADGYSPRSADAPAEIAYIAPEQIRGEAPDARSDQFAFGVMAYELLSGRRPFGGEHAADLMVQILSSEPIALGERSPDCPQAMARIVSRCLEKDPTRRFQDAGELAAAIAPLVDVVSEGPRSVTRVLDPAELKSEVPSPEARRAEARARIAQHLMRGELAQAEASLREVERAAGAAGFADLRTRLAELRDAERRTQVKSLLDSARRFFAEGDYDLAQRACVEALTLEPSESEAHRLLADTQQAVERQRHEDELETSRTIARAAVAELLASPEPSPREPSRISGTHSAVAPHAAERVVEDDTEATQAGARSAPRAPAPGDASRPAVREDSNVSSGAAPDLPSAAAARVTRIESMLASRSLQEARVAIEELKAEIRGNDLVRQEHARLSAVLVAAFQAQRQGRPSGPQPLVDAPGSRARVTATPPPLRAPTPSTPVTSPAPPAAPLSSAPAVSASAPIPARPSPASKGSRGGLFVALGALGLFALLAVAGGALWWWGQRSRTTLVLPPPPVAAAPKPARLTFPVNPLAGLTVRVDGGPPIPLVAGFVREVSPGKHMLTFEAPGTAAQQVEVELSSGELRTQSTPFLVPQPPVEPSPEAQAAPAKPKKRKAVVEAAPAPEPVETPAVAPEPPPPPPTERGDLVEAGPGVVAPRTLSIPGGKYPERARREKREATIGVLVLVDENGRPSEIKIQDGDPYGIGFDEAALAAVRAARFEPATKDGVQVKMWKLVRVGFRLK